MKEIRFLGTGSAFNTEQGNTAMYIKSNKNLLLIDCGELIFDKLIKNNVLNDVETVNVLITHLHSDHVGSLSSLVFYCFYKMNIKVSIYFPNSDELKNLMNLMGTIENSHYHINNEINNIKIRPIKTSHVDSMSCYSYLLTIDNKKIFYSGDSNELSFYKNNNIIKENIMCFQEACLNEYEGNVHTSVNKLLKEIPIEYRQNIFCMHIDYNELISQLYNEGFNVVDVNVNYFEVLI